MNVLRRELKANLKGLIIWIICIVIFMLLAGAEFSSFSASEDIDELMQLFPESIRAALSMDRIRFDKPEGYFGYAAQYLMVVAAIYAVLAGTGILSKEIFKKTAETTFTLPVTRRRILALKYAAVCINCLIFSVSTYLVTVAVFAPHAPGGDFAVNALIFASFMFLLQLLFALAGLFVSVVSRRHKRTGAIMASCTVVVYMLAFISNLGGRYEFLRFLTPFEYFPPVAIMNGQSLEAFGFVVVPALLIIFGLGSFVFVGRKDIY